jgi:EAL domain-containing protein (putative c-di-GMP-specific phosphodiesterase class I)
MQTQVMVEAAAGIPWLEYRAGEGIDTQRTPVASLPFSIGRTGAADLQIDSTRVSRNHAQILQDEQGYRVRDLESTNGTLVNGSRIQESPLVEGDILQIADVEFVFHCSASTDTAVVTQAMAAPSRVADDQFDAREFIRGVRRIHELTSRCNVSCSFRTIAELRGGGTFGYESVPSEPEPGPDSEGAESFLYRLPCPLTQRMRRLQQRMAIEGILDAAPEAKIFLSVDPSELQAGDFLVGWRHLCELVDQPGRLVLTFPVGIVGELVEFATAYSRLRDLGIGIAYDDVTEGQSLVRRISATPCDFLTLSASLVANIDHQEDRQRHVRSVVQASQDVGAEVIARGVESEGVAEICRNLGCRLGQGRHFPSPKRARELRTR